MNHLSQSLLAAKFSFNNTKQLTGKQYQRLLRIKKTLIVLSRDSLAWWQVVDSGSSCDAELKIRCWVNQDSPKKTDTASSEALYQIASIIWLEPWTLWWTKGCNAMLKDTWKEALQDRNNTGQCSITMTIKTRAGITGTYHLEKWNRLLVSDWLTECPLCKE